MLQLVIYSLLAISLVAASVAFIRNYRKWRKAERREKSTILSYNNRLEKQKHALHQLASLNNQRKSAAYSSFMHISELAAEVLSASAASFWSYDEAKQRLYCFEKFNGEKHYSPLPFEVAKDKECLHTLSHFGTQVLSKNTRRNLFSKLHFLSEPNTESILLTRILMDNKFRGVFCVERQDNTTWEEDERSFCVTLADHLITALLLYDRSSLEQELLLTSSAVSSSQDGIAILDYEGHNIFSNTAYCQIHGYESSEEIQGKPWYSFYDEEEHSRFKNHLLPLLRKKKKLTVETIGKKKSGRTYPQELSLSLIDGNRFVVVIRDISDRKRVEKNAHELALFTTLNPSPVIRFNSAGGIVVANPAAVDIFGIHRHQDIQEILPTLSRNEIVECIQAGKTIRFTDTVRGRIFFVTIRGLADLNIAHLYANDITALDKAERKLKESEQFLRLVMNANPSAIFVKDKLGRYTLANQTTAHLFGKDIDNIIGKTDKELLAHRDQAEDFTNDDKEVLESGLEKRIRREYLTTKDGKRHIFQTVKRPLFLIEENEPSHLLGVATDITETQALQDKLNQSIKMEAIGQLAGGIAHDFNNLLTGILGYTEILKQGSKPGTELQTASQKIESIALRAADLTQKLLGFARKEKQQLVFVDIHDIIEETMIMLDRTIDKRIQLCKRCDAKQPTVAGDPTQIQQIVLNLALNARDAISQNYAAAENNKITIETRDYVIQNGNNDIEVQIPPGEYIKLSVIDNGVGISQENIEKIFEPFFTTKEKGKGTGMGLAMVYTIVENHGGTIQVHSEKGKGTCFDIYLPSLPGESQEISNNIIEKDDTKALYGHGNILFVDDHSMIRDVTARMLSTLGYKVATAKDGFEALNYYEQNRNEIDLVILDMVMPRMGARECFKKMRQINPQARALLASGYINNKDVDDVMSEGMIGFVQKPFQIQILSKAIAEALQH